MASLEKANREMDKTGASILNDPMETPSFRTASGISNRKEQIMTWRLPNNSTVQMYINPENFMFVESKHITSTRTKGGFVIQYWGENLGKATLSGTTGSSGIRGINVLRYIYKSENRAFDAVASAQSNLLVNTIQQGNVSDQDLGTTLITNVAKQIRERGFILRPSLASLAVSVVLFYNGIQYKGFFTEFSVTESVQKLGLFDYNLTFMVTEVRGARNNFMAWHKEPIVDQPGNLNAAGNSLRSKANLAAQAVVSLEYHPESAPMSFGDTISTILDY